MTEHQSMDPEVARALRAYELAIRDGTERSQREAFRELLEVRQRALGGAAVASARQGEAPPEPEIKPDEQQYTQS